MLTHCHIDHAGSAAEVRRRTGARTWGSFSNQTKNYAKEIRCQILLIFSFLQKRRISGTMEKS
ncbi:MBL fold metallo-hydrolase [Spirosoma validum]|uniref:MBL fold metallo-hydrolase n=1 Tax=Spirosoma validum TaxID=2771355 RepID=UPI001CC2D3EC